MRRCGTLRGVNPDTPPVRQQLETWQKAAIAGAALLLVGLSVSLYLQQRPATDASVASPTPTRSATRAAVTLPTLPARSPAGTCADSASWAQDGGTSLIDAYINNQDSGNINVDEMKASCPQYLPTWQQAQGGIPDGESFAIPADVQPGTYETTSSDLEDCYWERSRGGNILDNRFVTASKVKLRVTIRSGDDTFVTKRCGNWIKVG